MPHPLDIPVYGGIKIGFTLTFFLLKFPVLWAFISPFSLHFCVILLCLPSSVGKSQKNFEWWFKIRSERNFDASSHGHPNLRWHYSCAHFFIFFLLNFSLIWSFHLAFFVASLRDLALFSPDWWWKSQKSWFDNIEGQGNFDASLMYISVKAVTAISKLLTCSAPQLIWKGGFIVSIVQEGQFNRKTQRAKLS